MCRYSASPGYVRSKAPERPKLGPLVPVIDAILEADKTAPPKQKAYGEADFEWLRIEHGYAGGYTVVKDYVRIARTRSREVFVPLAHPPGLARRALDTSGTAPASAAALGSPHGKSRQTRVHPGAAADRGLPETLVAAAALDAIRLGAISFDAVKQLVIAKVEHRPANLDLGHCPICPPRLLRPRRPSFSSISWLQ
jgi:hypothetical protein